MFLDRHTFVTIGRQPSIQIRVLLKPSPESRFPPCQCIALTHLCRKLPLRQNERIEWVQDGTTFAFFVLIMLIALNSLIPGRRLKW